jgi:hypothetical protein
MTQDERNRDDAEGPVHNDSQDNDATPETVAETGTAPPGQPAEDAPSPDGAPPDAPGEATESPPETLPPAPPSAPAPGGAGSMIIGGVLAAAIGAGAALVFLPEGWRRGETAVLDTRIAALEGQAAGIGASDLRTALEPLEGRLDTLETRIGALEGRSGPDLTPLEDRVSALESAPDGVSEPDLNAAIGSLTQRIDRIEAGLDAQARTAVEAALTEARAQIETRAEQLSAREETVAEAQARIAARAALAELVAAAESGVPAPGALATLTDQTGAEPTLAPLADGLPTLASLQERFAPAARAALAADAPEADAPLGDRLLTFLRSQTGARSLAPREGSDTDAILSRAEATLRAGDLQRTLAELDALAGDAAQALAVWRAQAETRLAVLAALDDMQTRLNGNED